MEYNPVVALEIGTTRTVALVGEQDQSGRISITGKGIYATHGVKKGMISDVGMAKKVLKEAVDAADKDGNVSVCSLFLGIRGGCIQTYPNMGRILRDNPGEKVTRHDIDYVDDAACDFSAYESEYTVLHTEKQYYHLDDQRDIVSPAGLVGEALVLDTLGICAKNTHYENLVNVAQDSDFDVEEVAFSGLCSADAVLTPEQKKSGALVIDLGGGTTDYAVYSGNFVFAAGSFAVGGDHVTNDIAQAFSLRTVQAETLKTEQGNARVQSGSSLKRVKVSAGLGGREHSISLKALHTVINARMTETLKLVRSELLKKDVLRRIKAGVVFTGGGAAMPGLLELGEDIFGIPCQIGVPTIGGRAMEDIPDPWAYASTVGLVKYGIRFRENETPGGLFGRFRTLFQGRKAR